VVECDLAKVEVASSNLVSRSKNFESEGGRMKDEKVVLASSFRLHTSPSHLARRRSQVVRQRSAKPLFIGSIPIAASILFNKLATI
jgi:hypothetical protein